LTGEPTADAIQMQRPVETARGYDEGRIELVQVPTRPLLRPTALVNQIVAVINQ
jgi:hypothetical protein